MGLTGKVPYCSKTFTDFQRCFQWIKRVKAVQHYRFRLIALLENASPPRQCPAKLHNLAALAISKLIQDCGLRYQMAFITGRFRAKLAGVLVNKHASLVACIHYLAVWLETTANLTLTTRGNVEGPLALPRSSFTPSLASVPRHVSMSTPVKLTVPPPGQRRAFLSTIRPYQPPHKVGPEQQKWGWVPASVSGAWGRLAAGRKGHPHPRIEYGAGSSPLPSKGEGTGDWVPAKTGTTGATCPGIGAGSLSVTGCACAGVLVLLCPARRHRHT